VDIGIEKIGCTWRAKYTTVKEETRTETRTEEWTRRRSGLGGGVIPPEIGELETMKRLVLVYLTLPSCYTL